MNLHSIINSGLIAGGRNATKERQTVFFTAVNPMTLYFHEQKAFDLTKPRVAVYKQKMESTPGRRLLGQFKTCSKKETDVLPDEVKRNHSLRHSPIIL